jgi:hypothetical protein
MPDDQLLKDALGRMLKTQIQRWREILEETGDERVELLALDAIKELESFQDASLDEVVNH